MMQWFLANKTMIGMVSYWVFSVLTSNMPEPSEKSSAAYAYTYRVMQAFAGIARWKSIGTKAELPPAPPVQK